MDTSKVIVITGASDTRRRARRARTSPAGEYVVKRKVARASKQARGAGLAARLQARSISVSAES
jgi:hypothetical protein